MKKHLFFAFAAAAVLASCSSHDDFDNYSAGTPQAPVDDNSPQEILLGVGAQANVATRGTGTVGGDHNDIDANEWRNQRIHVYMFNKCKVDNEGNPTTPFFTLATEGEPATPIYENALFMTPNGESTGAARHIDGLTATTGDYKRSYYPMNGNFDFWAYRLDDANVKYETIYRTFESGSEEAGYKAYKVGDKNMYSDVQIVSDDVHAPGGNWRDADEIGSEENAGGTWYQVYVKTTTNKVENTDGPKVISGTIDQAKITVPFIIDGSQDVMAASTELTAADADKLNGGTGEDPLLHESVEAYYPETTFKNYARSLYSAKTARKGVQPNLKFKHLLTRFTFDAIQMPDATNNDNEPVRIKKIEVKSKVSGEIVATYSKVESVPTGLDYVIGNVMHITGGTEDEEFLQLKKRPDTDNNPVTAPDQNEPLVDLTEGLQKVKYIVLKDNTVDKTSGGQYAAGDEATEAEINAEGKSYTLDEDYKIIELNGIELNTSTDTPIGEALLVMPGEAKYVMDITVEQTVYGRETAAGTGVKTSKKVETQTIKDLEIRAAEVNTGAEGITKFAAGNSYNVKVMVYGLTKIEVKTTLEPWVDGGHIDLDPDNQF